MWQSQYYCNIQGDRHVLFDAASFASHPSDDTCYVFLELTGHLSLRDFLNKENHLETPAIEKSYFDVFASYSRIKHWTDGFFCSRFQVIFFV